MIGKGSTRAIITVAVACSVAVGLVACASGGSTTASGRTMLTYPPTGASADALASGVLGVNAKGCITIGDSVLVVPEGSTLAPDGSIRVNGKEYRFGTAIQLGGGGGSPPAGSHCGTGQTYFWV